MQTNITKHLMLYRQRGIALIMSLVILLILTLLGVTSMNTSNLQLLMTSNSQYQMVALNTAEEVISTAQKTIKDTVGIIGAARPAGYFDTDVPKDITSFDWDGTGAANVTAKNSKYIIEYLQTQTLNSSSKAWLQSQGISGDNVSVFRITARTAASRGAMRYVQSIYVTLKKPGYVAAPL